MTGKTLTAVPVNFRDVIPHARKTCKVCAGTGKAVHVIAADRRITRACGCALKRFGKLQRLVTLKSGQVVAVEPFVAITPETLAEAEAVEAAKAAEEAKPEPAPEAAQSDSNSAQGVPAWVEALYEPGGPLGPKEEP